MNSLFLNIYSVYPEPGNDQMYGTTIDEKWPKCSPASLRDQVTILIRRTVHWRQRSSLPLPKHILFIIDDFPPELKPLLHFHFHRK
jgi:hypothetical protein